MVLMLNCSLKAKEGNTLFFMKLISQELNDCEILNIRDVLKNGIDEFAAKLQKADTFVIGAPLYVDGLPSQAVKLLEQLLESYNGNFTDLPVYVVSNLGFYEAKQIQHLLDMVRNWCVRMGCVYGGGLAVGAGPLLVRIWNLPVNKDVKAGISKMAKAISKKEAMGNYYTKTIVPRAVYLQAAHMSFRKTLKANGVKEK